MYCDKCGHEVEQGKNFCSNCGSEVRQETPEYFEGSVDEQTSVSDYEEPKGTDGLAVASLVCGIGSIFFAGIILGILGIIFFRMSVNKTGKSGMATAGMICGIIGLVVHLIVLALLIAGLVTGAGMYSTFF